MTRARTGGLHEIACEVAGCKSCPRLGRYLEELRARFPDYHNAPVGGFGDPGAWLVVVGLAPGLHGANRSGRPFFMDASGEWLYGALERNGLWDGSALDGVYIVNAVKCVPPQNRPQADELERCRTWLGRELEALEHAEVVLTLGALAHHSVLKLWDLRPLSRFPFRHGAVYRPEGRPALLASYHPSRQNTNTGRLTRPMWRRIFTRAGEFRA